MGMGIDGNADAIATMCFQSALNGICNGFVCQGNKSGNFNLSRFCLISYLININTVPEKTI